MAGIGFRLQKLLKEDSYTGLLKGYLFSRYHIIGSDAHINNLYRSSGCS